MSSEDQQNPAVQSTNHYPAWSPRFWHGMRAGCWWRLLASNRFKISLRRAPTALAISFFTPINDLLAIAQSLTFGRRINRTQIERDPIFILGHWRSGTTFLHELMVTDPQFASPSTYQCFAPSHFLVSEWLMVRFGGFLLPQKRPMDNMDAGWRLPQEDEFALMNLGVPTPYLRIAFPQTQPQAMEYLDFRELTDEDRQQWREKFLWFIRALTCQHGGKQLVMKSPPHTGRLAELAELFPNAKFIHLTRDPRKLFLSTLRLWKSLEEVQAFQPHQSEATMREYVWECLTRMYSEFEQAREHVCQDRLVDIRYEDLVTDPIATLRGLYAQLDLGDFELVQEQLQQRLEHHDRYRPNSHSLDSETEREIFRRWSDYAKRYGYDQEQELVDTAADMQIH